MDIRKRTGPSSTLVWAVLLSLAGHVLLVALAVCFADPFAASGSGQARCAAGREPALCTLDDPPPARVRKATTHPNEGSEDQDRAVSCTLVDEPPRTGIRQASGPRIDLTPTLIGPSPGPPTLGRPGGNAGAGTKGGGGAETGPRWLPPIQQAKSVVYLVDHSLSMGMRHGLSEAQRELLTALAGMPPAMRFQLLAYNGEVTSLASDVLAGLVSAEQATLQRTRRALMELQASGSTQPALALRRGLALRPEVLVLMTDADELTTKEIQEATYFNGGHTAIHVVVFHWRQETVANTPLQQLAQRNRGTYRLVVPQP